MSDQPQTRLLVVGALAWVGGAQLLVQRRSDRARHGAGCLELAGGKVEAGEAPAAALRRELVEEWGPGASRLPIGGVADVLHHVYPPPGREIVLVVYHVDARRWAEAPALEGADGATLQLVDADAPPLPAFLAADRPLVERVARGEVRAPDWTGC
jgi:8-oxo-dGTP diphosphatase